MIILKDIITNYKDYTDGKCAEQLKTVHITNGKVEYIDPIEQLKNLKETIDGSPKELYEQTNINN